MNKDITHYAKTRYTAKKYNTTKKILNEDIKKVKELLRYSPSSTNAQPWHFILASTQEGKEKIARATQGIFSFNSGAILDASHVVVFCNKTDIDEDFLLKVLEQEDTDGRFGEKPEFKKQMHAGRSMFVNMHRDTLKDVDQWSQKQTYLNVGAFLLGVSTLGIDATAMEGFDVKVLNEEFSLSEKGYTSAVIVPIGYHDPEKDNNAKRPKSRLEYSEILTEI